MIHVLVEVGKSIKTVVEEKHKIYINCFLYHDSIKY
ncbi:hypothetical protein SDC9_51981 [bioreactor metagenome]|uniref:Uncharacterized protein n=1 Tax=bioreactor metagenome TaxID=1076179 RepID=A0A644WPF5_9ZZZZ